MKYIDVYTPDSVIAAALPYSSERPRDVAYNNAAYALDREDVHLIYTTDGDTVYYVAAASEDFAGHFSAVSPLAAALPGTKGHQGDGAYVAIAESGYAVVIKKESEMFSYVGDRDSVDAFIQSHDVPTYSSSDNDALPWEGYNLGSMSRATKVAKTAIVFGCIFVFATFLAWFGIASLSDNVEAEAESLRRESETSIKNAAREMNTFTAQPLVKDIKDLQTLIQLCSEVGGYVHFYEKIGKEESWEVHLPTWVTSTVIERFGKGVNPKKDDERNIIVVQKNVKEDDKKKRRR